MGAKTYRGNYKRGHKKMSISLKWLPLILFLAALVFAIGYYFSIQNNTVRTTSDLEYIMQTVNVGEARLKGEEAVKINAAELLNKEELVSNLVANVINEQTALNNTVQVNYTFTDSSYLPTTDDSKIRGVYFEVNLLDGEGNKLSSSEKHLALDIQYR